MRLRASITLIGKRRKIEALRHTVLNPHSFPWHVSAGDGASEASTAKFSSFFGCCQDLICGSWPSQGLKTPLSFHERAALTVFLINVFQSLEQPAVRAAALKLTSLPLWSGTLRLSYTPVFMQCK